MISYFIQLALTRHATMLFYS